MIDGKTKVCCVIGNPVEHLLSPTIHNAAYEKLGLNFAYVAFCVEDVRGAVSGEILILDRTLKKAKELARETGASYGTLEELTELRNSDILIHATPAGMHPDIDKSVVPETLLHRNLTISNIVYNPVVSVMERILIKHLAGRKG